jgi:DNA-binding LytR/AlgR family response regulator
MIKCIIVDDDLASMTIVEYFVSRIAELELIGTFTDSVAALAAIRNSEPNLIFLDVEMPGLTGMDILNLLPDKRNVIFITGSPKYAVDSFDLGIVDYLLKPVSFERFQKAVNRYKEKIGPQKLSELLPAFDKKKNNAIYVKENYKTVKINLKSILYLESLKEYVNIVTENRNIRTKQRLTFFENELPNMSFIRIHKSYIVAADKIISFTQNQVEIPSKNLPVGRNYKDSVKAKLDKISKKS